VHSGTPRRALNIEQWSLAVVLPLGVVSAVIIGAQSIV
jgi:hypothetical protein